ncbi:DUF366 family protein [Methanococcus aeolicus]|uniref:DUF366 domain-containing protein n=1 Tax=Methanococcus aeolicus (strain ATCC BAA-1280 / DSM 17508 / OCM 812 / Nankai-3) TaxID=419665 RepID=A6UUV4_META3|nr:DUF366 family protein [Methanococcus aeolicus]ABR56276.1 protein of unknown function DUF366 [Methanococcus aeolicus Nankai-3]UXM84286.1 DUF366 family protein [Methanococcus aeolicus]
MKKIEFDNITSLIITNEKIDYTGIEIEPLWAYKNFDIQKDSIVAFQGGLCVSIDNMKDLKDIKEEAKHGDILIKSSRAINFIVEHFDNPDLKMAYLRQRILIANTKEVIEEITNNTKKIIRKGDDLYYNNGKLSVSIACRGISSSKIHLGINIANEDTPNYINTSSLDDLGINIMDDANINNIMEKIAIKYGEEMEKIEKDIRKTQCI